MAKVPISITVYSDTIDGMAAAADAALAAVKPMGWTIEEKRLSGPCVPVGSKKANPGDPDPPLTEWYAEVRASFVSP